jgi:hypothetical protein
MLPPNRKGNRDMTYQEIDRALEEMGRLAVPADTNLAKYNGDWTEALFVAREALRTIQSSRRPRSVASEHHRLAARASKRATLSQKPSDE